MKRIFALGDSNTYGYDPRSYLGGRYGADVRWTGLLGAAGFQVINAGQNGLSIPAGAQLSALEASLRRALPLHAVTVMLGSNDLLQGASAKEAAERMELLLSRIGEAAGAPLLLIAPPPMKRGAWVESDRLVRESRLLAEAYAAVAGKTGAAFADAGAWDIALTFDGVHFSPAGHAAFAGGLRPILERLTDDTAEQRSQTSSPHGT